MSYSKHYNASVSYSGSVSYSYPASQNGGTGSASYHGSVPVSITINVDTDPFDNSVNRFNGSVNVLAGSVAAMNAAQCAAIKQTATEVSAALISGFFNTVNTELTQQIQALGSAMQAGMGLLLEQGKAVSDKKNVMEGDYNRISSRYVRLFADLDNECYKRIYALDKQSFSLSEKVLKELLSESASDTAAMNLLGVEEAASSKNFVFVSSLNRKSLDVLRTLHDYITQESKINSLVNSFLFSEEIGEIVPLYIPVLWSESDQTDGNSINRECFIPEYVDPQCRQAMTEKVNAFCSGSSPSAWEDAEKTEKESVNKEFNILAEKQYANAEDDENRRIYKTLMSLWQNSQQLSLKRSES
jgi:hypothetical protein